jgi:transcriptional regulator with XRE-family HTH domain
VIGVRLKEERERLGLNQTDFGALASATKRTQVNWEQGGSSPSAEQLAALAGAGVDVQYVVTGIRAGQGIGRAAVHQAVLNAVELLSLESKVDAQQLAKAVVKLTASQASRGSERGATQTFNGPVTGQVTSGDVLNTAPVTFNVETDPKKNR